jgi:hypothetical protein
LALYEMAESDTKRQNGLRKARADLVDKYGFRGGGASWQAKFGLALNEADLLLAAKREPVIKRTVIDVADDVFAKGFTVEKAAEKSNLDWSREVWMVQNALARPPGLDLSENATCSGKPMTWVC